MDQIKFNDFKKLDIRMGEVKSAEGIEGLDKILKLMVDIGGEERQILAGVAEYFEPEELVGKVIPILVNLEPKVIRGLESQGMLLAADVEGKPVFLTPEEKLPAGSKVH